MTDITIPPEALEASKDTAFAWLRSFLEDDVRVQQMTDEELSELVSAACLAMLKAWPGIEHQTPNEWSNKPHIILPLTQEKK